MSLEADGRTGGVPIAYQRDGESFKYVNEGNIYDDRSNAQTLGATDTVGAQIELQPLSQPKDIGPGDTSRVRPRSMLCWSALFALVLVLAIVTAAVAGSIATKRGEHIERCMSKLQNLNATLQASESSDRNSSTARDNSTSITDPTCNNTDTASFVATSDCSSLASPYTPPSINVGTAASNSSFNIYCDTDFDYVPADFISFVSYTFEDCIAACASYNQRVPVLHPNSTCYGASFDVGKSEGQGPSCFLKAIQNLTPTSRPGVTSSAMLITS